MIALHRAVIVIERPLISLFALLFATLVFDLPSAWFAQPCSVRPITPNCYPWGAEGPVAGVWSYSSKQNYLASGFYGLGIAAIGLSSLLWLSAGRRILVLLAATILMYVGSYALPLIF